MTIALIANALILGYTLGRWRPAHRASDWAHWLMYRTPRVTRRDWHWWAAQSVYACEIAVMLATRPRATVHAWRHRHDPPPPRSPAPRIDPDWAERRRRENDPA